MRNRIATCTVILGLLLAGFFAFRILAPQKTTIIEDAGTVESVDQQNLPSVSSQPTKPAAISPVPKTAPESVVVDSRSLTARELIAKLKEIAASDPITTEQAALFKQLLADLIQQGDAAVPAIRELMEKKLDSDFLSVTGGDQLSYPTLRAALIDALKQIGGPEAQALIHDVLIATTSSDELMTLAQNLDQLAPGQYRNDIINSANKLLKLAAENKLGENAELGPAFRILNAYGTADMAENPSDHVATKLGDAAALAKLADAGGLDELIQVAGDSKSSPTDRTIASQMIAQLAGQNDKALETLVRMAGNGEISNSAWQQIAPILGGNEPGSAGTTGPPTQTATPEQINQRISMIDHFLKAVAADSAAAAALHQQRSILAGKLSN